MAFDFPNTPTIGQIYQGYIWDGLAWQVQPAAAQGVVRYDVAQGLTSPQQSQAISNLGLPFNCGRLQLVNTTTLSFLPFNGDLIKINGLVYRIPSGGIAGLANTNVFIDGVAGQNLVASKLYYVYAFINAGVVTASYSATGHGTSSTAGNEGIEVKNGDNSRTLLGMLFTNASAQFSDILTASWFNRRSKTTSASLGNLSTTSAVTVILSAAVPMLVWSDEAPSVVIEGQAGTTGTYAYFYVAIDTKDVAHGSSQFVFNAAAFAPLCIGGFGAPLSEGLHNFYSGGSAASGSGTATINNVGMALQMRG